MDALVLRKVEHFFSQYPTKSFKSGEILVNVGERSQYIYYVIRGHVKQSGSDKRGNDLVYTTYRNPSFFPISAGNEKLLNEYRYQAVETTLVCVAPMQDVMAWLKTEPDVMFDLIMRLQSGLQGLLHRLSFAMVGTSKEKIILELLINAERHGQQYENGYKLKMSVNELAARSGIARETASRELASLKRLNLVKMEKGNILIVDSEKLKAQLA